jgi:hypothetical protein
VEEYTQVAAEGRGRTLGEAFEHAWEEAKKAFPDARTFAVLRIVVFGDNPISGYGVVLAPGP